MQSRSIRSSIPRKREVLGPQSKDAGPKDHRASEGVGAVSGIVVLEQCLAQDKQPTGRHRQGSTLQIAYVRNKLRGAIDEGQQRADGHVHRASGPRADRIAQRCVDGRVRIAGSCVTGKVIVKRRIIIKPQSVLRACTITITMQSSFVLVRCEGM